MDAKIPLRGSILQANLQTRRKNDSVEELVLNLLPEYERETGRKVSKTGYSTAGTNLSGKRTGRPVKAGGKTGPFFRFIKAVVRHTPEGSSYTDEGLAQLIKRALARQRAMAI